MPMPVSKCESGIIEKMLSFIWVKYYPETERERKDAMEQLLEVPLIPGH